MFVISGTLYLIFSGFCFILFNSSSYFAPYYGNIGAIIFLILGLLMYGIEIYKYMKKHPKKEGVSMWGTWEEVEKRDKKNK